MVSPGGTIFWLSCGSGPVPAVLSGVDSGGGDGRVTPPDGDPPGEPALDEDDRPALDEDGGPTLDEDGWAATAGEGEGAAG
jgi:hypothetical protein